MGEDFDNHRRIFDGGPRRGRQAMIFKLPPQFGQCSMSMSKTRLSSLAQLSAPARPARDRMRARLLALADWGRFHDAALRSARARHGSGLP